VTALTELYRRSIDEFGRRVRDVGVAQWHLPTPNEAWNVRDLVQHLVSEELWAPPLLAGATLEEVGDRFDGDLLGEDPKAAWEAAARAAVVALPDDFDFSRSVHVSFGQIPAAEYVGQLICDHTIHAWDLARAIGAEERLDPELVEFAYGALEPQIESWRAAAVFGPAVDVPPDASRQEQLLALTGRRP
jgi:uncharacterized protein (TIGR03086 family)